MSGGFRFNYRNCDACPVTELFWTGKEVLHLGKALVVGGCKEDGKVIGKSSGSFFQWVRVGVGGMPKGVAGAAQVA